MTSLLAKNDHRRDIVGLKYIYPVHSRRSGGLSIGINVNTNNACNWQCVYCQVPELKKGGAPTVDLFLLKQELRTFLKYVLEGSFFDDFKVPPHERIIKDFAISGNGEPTTLKNFDELVLLIGNIAQETQKLIFEQYQKNESPLQPSLLIPEPTLKQTAPTSDQAKFKLVLITNGSLIHLPQVQNGLKIWNQFGGEVWFKLDSATELGRQQINQFKISNENVWRNLNLSLQICQTKIQTCLLENCGAGASAEEANDYVNFFLQLKELALYPEILIYTIARPSHQPGADQLKPMSLEKMQSFAHPLQEIGFKVKIST